MSNGEERERSEGRVREETGKSKIQKESVSRYSHFKIFFFSRFSAFCLFGLIGLPVFLRFKDFYDVGEMEDKRFINRLTDF